MKKIWNLFVLFLLLGVQVLKPAAPVVAASQANGLYITRLTPTGASGHPFDMLEFQFSSAVKDGTFTLVDVIINGPGGAITPIELTKLTGDRYALNLSGSTGAAIYSLSVGPDILDSNNQPLDQNHNGVGGQSDDVYQAALFSNTTTIAANNFAYDGQNLVLHSSSITIDGVHAFSSLEVLGGALLTHSPATSTSEYRLELSLPDGLWIDAVSKIDVTGKGYLPGRTLGNTTTGQASGLAGGSYGGLGAFRSGVPNQTYGDYRNPNEPGAGSGNANTYASTGSAGGGLVRITAASAQVDGSILALGSGPVTDISSGPAGGAGGGIYLKVGALSGTGYIRADGGKNGWGSQEGGAGGGGRAAVFYTSLSGFDLSHISANSGTVSYYSLAAVGTVYLKQDGSAGILRLDSQGNPYAAGAWTPLGIASDTLFEAEDVVISGEGVMAAPQHEMPLRFANLTLSNKAILTHQPASTAETFSLRLTVTGTLTIDASAKIDVTGKGYLAGHTLGNTSAGQSTGTAGGSYGGLGSPRSTDRANRTYGDPANPLDPGSGSGNANTFNYPGSPGGGVARITAENIVVNGSILAMGSGPIIDPSLGPGAGSGGSIFLDVNTLNGSGTISANGGQAGWGGGEGGGGGGGRVAVYFRAGNTIPSANITANGGLDAYGGSSPGSVSITNRPAYLWSAPRGNLVHGHEVLAWCAPGQPWLSAQVDLYQSGAWIQTLGTALPAEGSLAWDTTTVPDGIYDLRVTFFASDQTEMGRASRLVLINNAAVWHSGDIGTSETWDASKIHILEADVAVNPGITLTIQAGTVIKAAPRVEFYVQTGAILNAAGSSGSPIILTSLADDSAGGDTNLDGLASQPRPGDWRGLTVLSGGQGNLNANVDLRYVYRIHSGALSGSETWKGTDLHLVASDVTIPSGATLTVQPGAVVKFNPNTMLSAAAGGSLSALGLVSKPIYFTSYKDDTIGGDSNEDGSATFPLPGDWVTLRISGSANFDHIIERYASGSNAGGYQSFSAMITAEAGSSVTLSNSLLQDGLYDGLIYQAPLTVSNTILANMQRGLFILTSGSGIFNNLVIDQTNTGVFCHGGTAQINNSVIYRSVVNGVRDDCATLSYSDVWSETGQNYSLTNQTGLRGNISVHPKFTSADTGNYRPSFGSPLIDAADSTLAPLTDWIGAPRYDDPRSANSGIANSAGAFADIGAFEFVENAPSDLDLLVTTVDGPRAALAGSLIHVTYTVQNQGSGIIHGPWRDEIGLLGSNELVADTVIVGSDLRLGPGQSQAFDVQVRVPGGIEGPYRWQVKVNARGDFFEGQNRANNTGLSAALVSLQVPELVAGGTVQSGIWGNVGQAHWYKLNAAAGQDLQLSLDNSDNSASTEMYLARGVMPTTTSFDFSQNPGAGDLNLTFHSPDSAVYYVLIRAAYLPNGSQGYSLRARALGFEITSSSPNLVGNTGGVLVTLRGGGLRSDAIYEVVAPNAVAYQAKWINFIDSSEVQAQFDFANLPLGAYILRVREGGSSATLAGALTVEQGKPPVILVSASHPKEVRRYSVPTIVFNYTNSSNIDLPPALLNIKINNNLAEYQVFGAQLARYADYSPTDQIYQVMIPALGPRQSGQFMIRIAANIPGEFPLSIEGFSIGMDGSQFARPLDRHASLVPHLIEATGDTYLHTTLTVQTSSGSGDLDFQLHKESAPAQIDPTISLFQNGDMRTWKYEITTSAASSSPSAGGTPGSSKSGFFTKIWETITGKNGLFEWIKKIFEYKNAADLAISQKQVNDCLLNGGYVNAQEYDELNRFSESVIPLKIITDGTGQMEGMDDFSKHYELMNGTMGTGWPNSLWKQYQANLAAGWWADTILARYNPQNGQEVALAVIQECFTTTKNKTNSTIVVKESEDPNEISGPAGYGISHYVNGSTLLNYTVEFENKPTATLPAQEVVITDQIDPAKFDLSTFQLGPVWIGDQVISVPAGKDNFSSELDLRPKNDLILKMDASLDHQTGMVTWRFTSLDPLTREVTSDSLAGFLPPNLSAPEGQGGVSYSIYPKAGQANGTMLQAQASITFDSNPALQTAVWTNVLDTNTPSSTIKPLPAWSASSFKVSWEGSDDPQGAGIESYDIYVSDNGGSFKLWKSGMTGPSAVFTGQVGHTYGFYSVSTDGVGHRQSAPAQAQASTRVSIPIFLPVVRR
jgi:hypothetical protein